MANIKKNATGYGYKYTDLAAINDYIESIGETYYQETETVGDVDYIITVRTPVLDEATSKLETLRIRGCRVIQASLSGKTNPAQEQGSGLTYARRYSLLMAYGLATEDDDGQSLTIEPKATPVIRNRTEEIAAGAEPMGAESTLDRAKKAINAELIDQNYITSDAKKAFIARILGKDTIDTIGDAELVDDELNNLKDTV